MFYVTITRDFGRFQCFKFETSFLKNENKKNKNFKILEHRFIVESTKIENALFRHKFAMSDTNVKKNKMISRKSYRTEFCQYQFNFF